MSKNADVEAYMVEEREMPCISGKSVLATLMLLMVVGGLGYAAFTVSSNKRMTATLTVHVKEQLATEDRNMNALLEYINARFFNTKSELSNTKDSLTNGLDSAMAQGSANTARLTALEDQINALIQTVKEIQEKINLETQPDPEDLFVLDNSIFTDKLEAVEQLNSLAQELQEGSLMVDEGNLQAEQDIYAGYPQFFMRK